MLTFTRSTPLPSIPPSNSTHHSKRPSANPTNTQNRTNQSTSNNYYGGNSSSGHYNSRGRGGYSNHGGSHHRNHHDGMSASQRLHQQIHRNSDHHAQTKHSNVAVFHASAAGTAAQQHQLSDKQEISEPATIIWCEGGIGEVMSPSVWRNPNLHLYFDATRTIMEQRGGWGGLEKELEAGMEMDVTFTLSSQLQHALQDAQYRHAANASYGGVAGAEDEPHTFICIGKIAEIRASKCSSIRTREQAVVIAKRESGAAFLINNSGERTVLHPNFLPQDGVRHAILEKAQGQRQITIDELDSPSSLCVLGRSLAVRLAPAPSWLPTIYPTDRGVTRWALSAEPYGEEKQGRAVVVQSTRLAITLCAVEGDLAGKKTTLHAPIIQMTGQIKLDAQVLGSCWRFRACRELPGRAAVWRAFQLDYELDTDPPIVESVIEALVSGNRLIDVESDEEFLIDPLVEEEPQRRRREEVKTPSVLDDLATLQFAFTREQQLLSIAEEEAASAVQTPAVVDDDEEVLVFESIDDMLDSETFATDIFRAPSILQNEWQLLGVPPAEAIKTEQEMQQSAVPLAVASEPRLFGVYVMGDERPDMVVKPKEKKKRKSRNRRPSVSLSTMSDDVSDEERKAEDKPAATGRTPPGDSEQREEDMEGAPAAPEQTSKERKREAKEDSRMKKHLASIDVKFATASDDLFDMLHGGGAASDADDAPIAAASATTTREQKEKRAKSPPPPVATVAPTTVTTAVCSDLFDLLHGGAPASASSSEQKKEKRVKTPPPVVTVAGGRAATVTPTTIAASSDLFDMLHGDAPASSSSPAPSSSSIPSSTTTAFPSMIAVVSTATASVPAVTTVTAVTSSSSRSRSTAGDELFDLLHGGTAGTALAAAATPAASVMRVEVERVTPGPPGAASDARPPGSMTLDDAVAAAELDKGAPEHALLIPAEPLTRPRAPRVAILPYPEKPKHADGWWFRPSRARPPPVEGKKERRKKKQEAEERARAACVAAREAAEAAARAPNKDEKKDETVSVEPKPSASGVEKKKEEERKEQEERKQEKEEEAVPVMENVLVDLSPSSESPSPSDGFLKADGAADSPASLPPSLPSPTEHRVQLHDDLKDLF